jgi:uncharacterized membrane protein (DUF4010 family)
VLAAGATALVVAGYTAASRTDIDATTEASALVVVAAGVLAGLGQLMLASASIAATSFFLLEKSRLHALAARIDDEALRAAVRFAVMAVVVLPLLPAGPFGPWDTVRPRELWLIVLFCSGLSFAAFLARRAVGDRHGYPLAGLLGGLISSTNVTFTFAQASRGPYAAGAALALGVAAACTILFLRVAIVAAALNPALAREALPFLLPPLGAGIIVVAWGLWRSTDAAEHVAAPTNPLQLRGAIQMALVFQAVLIAVELAHRTLGNAGLLLSGAVLGLTDVDALTVAMARGGADSAETAARVLAVGILANTLMKIAIAASVGRGVFRRSAVPALAVLAVAAASSLLLVR